MERRFWIAVTIGGVAGTAICAIGGAVIYDAIYDCCRIVQAFITL